MTLTTASAGRPTRRPPPASPTWWAYSAPTHPANGDPKALKTALEEEFGLIFERCTMEGEAHNQLDNYLLPIHQALRDLEGDEAQRAALGAQLAGIRQLLRVMRRP
ncbi:MAG: hypothetical protein IPM68_15340 [Flavobacteriales bacterium]|nr:hypothetical protein [Flavobacteriales bacterium]